MQLLVRLLRLQTLLVWLCCNCEQQNKATGVRTMRSLLSIVLPVIVAASASGFMFTATLA